MFEYFSFGAFVCPPLICSALICPPLPPRPFTPAGVKGSWNRQLGFFGPDRDFGASACDTVLRAEMGGRGSRSPRLGAWRGCVSSAPSSVCKVSASERARARTSPLGRAEQRSAARIRLGACLSEASLRPAPGGASSAGHPAGARPRARLFFGYFLLAKQKKVARPRGRNLNLTSGQNLVSKTLSTN